MFRIGDRNITPYVRSSDSAVVGAYIWSHLVEVKAVVRCSSMQWIEVKQSCCDAVRCSGLLHLVEVVLQFDAVEMTGKWLLIETIKLHLITYTCVYARPKHWRISLSSNKSPIYLQCFLCSGDGSEIGQFPKDEKVRGHFIFGWFIQIQPQTNPDDHPADEWSLASNSSTKGH